MIGCIITFQTYPGCYLTGSLNEKKHILIFKSSSMFNARKKCTRPKWAQLSQARLQVQNKLKGLSHQIFRCLFDMHE